MKAAPVGLFSMLYILAASIAAIGRQNHEFLLYIGVMVFLAGVVGWVHLRSDLSRGALWCLSIWGLAHMAGGLVPVPVGWPYHGDTPVLYSLWLVTDRLKYDQLVHAYGFGVTTWVCWEALRAGTGIRRPGAGPIVLCAAAGLGFGALNEVIEFAATLLVPETNVGGYLNTGWDLVANLVGASIAAGWIAIATRSAPARDEVGSA